MATVFTAGPIGKTKREFLFEHNLTKAPTGRGRFSLAANEFLAAAEAAGVIFTDNKPAVKPAPKASDKAAIVVTKSDTVETLAEAEREDTKTDSKWTAPAVPAAQVFQAQQTHYAISEKPGSADIVVGFDKCYSDACKGLAVKYCPHDEPTPPTKGLVYMGTDYDAVRA